MQVEHDMRKIGELYFEINTALHQGVRQFVTYQATDTVIFTVSGGLAHIVDVVR